MAEIGDLDEAGYESSEEGGDNGINIHDCNHGTIIELKDESDSGMLFK